jgi:hypothetical protein
LNVAEAKKEAVRLEQLRQRDWSSRTISDIEAQLNEACWGFQAERRTQCAVLRDLVGNPIRPIVFDPAWRTPTIVALALSTYDTLAPEGMLDRGLVLTLGECLADAGCTHADLLEHLRGAGPHYRGCWGLDAVLGKA